MDGLLRVSSEMAGCVTSFYQYGLTWCRLYVVFLMEGVIGWVFMMLLHM